jgi:sigma-B regulation protein RsbU (phosphoserine phosphatase)
LLDAEGLVLGVLPQVEFEEKALTLAPGDLLLLYTDGVVESRDETGEFFGLSRLCERFTANRQLSPQAIVRKILSELHSFAAEIEDDVTLLVACMD